MKSPLIPYTLLTCAGLFLGIGVSYVFDKNEMALSSSEQAQALASGNKRLTQDGIQAPDQIREESLDEIIASGSTLNHVQKINAHINKMTFDELKQELLKFNFHFYSGNLHDTRALAFSLILNKMGEISPTQGLKLAALLGRNKKEAEQEILKGWAGKDPVNAANYVLEQKDLRTEFSTNRASYSDLVSIVAERWAHHHPEEALKWVRDINKGENIIYTNTIPDIFSIIAEKDPQKAIALMESDPVKNDLDHKQSAIAKTWARKNWDEAKAWIDSLSDVKNKDYIYGAALESLALYDPQKALQEFPKTVTNSTSFNEAARTISQFLIEEGDIGSAAQWVLNNAPECYDAIQNITSTWMKKAPQETLNWIEQLPTGFSKDFALLNYADKNTKAPPVENATLFQQVDSKGDYWERRFSIFMTSWNKTEPEKAQEWIKNADLKPEVKDKINAQLKKN